MTTEFRFTQNIATGIQNYDELVNLVNYESRMAQSDRALIFVDNHDNQRGHGADGKYKTNIETFINHYDRKELLIDTKYQSFFNMIFGKNKRYIK